MTLNIIGKYLPDYEEPKIVFVGGSSNCPYLRKMLHEEIQFEEVDCEVNPDYVVAQGVALYAQMMDEGKVNGYVEDVTKRLCIEDDQGRSLTIVDSNTSIPCQSSITVSNPVKGDSLKLKLYQGDSIVARNNEYIGTLDFNYEREVEAHEGIVEVTVNVSADGIVTLSAMEVLFGEDFRQSITLTAR